MKPSRFRTLLIGLLAGIAYSFLIMWYLARQHMNVSIAYIFVLPVIMGALPVLFSTKEQLRSYWSYLVMPWLITACFFLICFLSGFEGMICMVIIFGPFVLLGSLGAFIFRLIRLKNGNKKTPLYVSLFLPLLVFFVERDFQPADQYGTVTTTIDINAGADKVWEHIKNVRDIKRSEIPLHFVHFIGVPRPLDGRLNYEGPGGTRFITWEKGIRFREVIKTWDPGKAFTYDIKVDPASIPPETLDEHVMIGGRYFGLLDGGYSIERINEQVTRVRLSCRYRITTNLNFYSRWWADYILDDFNEMILEVIKKRCEQE